MNLEDANQDAWLVLFDTDRIKRYLFMTNQLKEIRSASALLDKLNKDMSSPVLDTNPRAEKIYTGGGGGLFIVPGDETDAQKVVKAVERLYRRETGVASITGAVLPLAPATREKQFGERVNVGQMLLRRHKDSKAHLVQQPVAPYLHICDACGQAPASKTHTRDGETNLLCSACYRKRSFKPTDLDKTPVPQDFNELGELSQPPGYMGFIYADGNLLGSRLSTLTTAKHYTTFADGVRTLMQKSRDTALASLPRPNGYMPALTLLLGGDDLMMVVAAQHALPVALALAKNFEQNSADLLNDVSLPPQPPLTLSVGVVLAHSSFPVIELEKHAQARLDTAKQCSAEEGYIQGAIDFEVLTAASGQEQWGKYENKRPYSLSEMELLLNHAQRLVNFPSSQLQTMYESLSYSLTEATLHESLSYSRTEATLACLITLARHRNDKQRCALRDFLNEPAWTSTSSKQMPPWLTPEGRRTALGDLVEILPFVDRGGNL